MQVSAGGPVGPGVAEIPTGTPSGKGNPNLQKRRITSMPDSFRKKFDSEERAKLAWQKSERVMQDKFIAKGHNERLFPELDGITAEQLEPVPSDRKKGRPKSLPAEEGGDLVKRKRGRPRKEDQMTETETSQKSVEKKCRKKIQKIFGLMTEVDALCMQYGLPMNVEVGPGVYMRFPRQTPQQMQPQNVLSGVQPWIVIPYSAGVPAPNQGGRSKGKAAAQAEDQDAEGGEAGSPDADHEIEENAEPGSSASAMQASESVPG
mmetsp:Transcript_41642/g.64982  ORF Transcript_41642/g.64982 Transcript_41642/m.64982 type:complete len:262 (-) Transcript_41642:776-1561(-)